MEDGGIAIPANLTTEAVGRYILWLDRQRSRAGEPWSTSTRHGRFVHVKMMLTWAMRNRTDRLTVATLAREARVARNTIYTNHRSILDGLNRTDHQSTNLKRSALAQKTAEFAALIEQLQQQKGQLATENAALLKRAFDAEEILDRLQKQNAKLLHQLAAAHQPITLSRR